MRQRRIPFTVMEASVGAFPKGIDPSMVRRVLGITVISITERKVLSGSPWISRYGKRSVGEALTALVDELFDALPETENVLVFSVLDGRWRLTGYRLGFKTDTAITEIERELVTDR